MQTNSQQPTDAVYNMSPHYTQNGGQHQEEMLCLLKWPSPLSGPSEILPFAVPKYTSLYFLLMVHRSALWGKAEEMSSHDRQKCRQIAIVSLKSYLCIGNTIPCLHRHRLWTFSSETNTLDSPLRGVQLITRAFQNNQKQTVENLAHFVTHECLISLTHFLKFNFFSALTVLLLFKIFYFFKKRRLCPTSSMTTQGALWTHSPAKLVKIIFKKNIKLWKCS